jgi:hypothetical protein
MPTWPEPDRPHSLCPRCAPTESRGLPFSVTEGPSERRIAYRCPACEHVWAVVTTLDSPNVMGSDGTT